MGAATQGRRYLLVVVGLLEVVGCTAQRSTPSGPPAPARPGSFAVPVRSGTLVSRAIPSWLRPGSAWSRC